MPQAATSFAALNEQLALVSAVPKESGVVADAGRRPFGWRGQLDRLFLGAVGLGRTELENAEQELADLFITCRLFREISHDQRYKKTGA